jgi:hypothetical protein
MTIYIISAMFLWPLFPTILGSLSKELDISDPISVLLLFLILVILTGSSLNLVLMN